VSAEKLHVFNRVCLITCCNKWLHHCHLWLAFIFLLGKVQVERERFKLFNYLPACQFFRVCLTEVTGLIVFRPLVNIGLANVAFMSIKPHERMPLQRFKSITDVVKYSLTPVVRKAIWKDAFTCFKKAVTDIVKYSFTRRVRKAVLKDAFTPLLKGHYEYSKVQLYTNLRRVRKAVLKDAFTALLKGHYGHSKIQLYGNLRCRKVP